MSELKQAFEQVIWQVLEKHYNVDRREPRILTYKHIMVNNPVGDLADQITNITEELIKQAITQVASQIDESVAPQTSTSFTEKSEDNPNTSSETRQVEWSQDDEEYFHGLYYYPES